jgi:hypothetical protein
VEGNLEGCSPYPQEKWAFMFWLGQVVIDQVQQALPIE